MQIRKILRIAPVLAASAIASLASGVAVAGGLLDVDFDYTTNFTDPLSLDNPYWPLRPAGSSTVFIYLTETEDGCVFNKITADDGDTKMFMNSADDYEYYDGILAQVVVDREWEVDMECAEVMDELADNEDWEPMEGIGEWTYDWYINDDDDNTWYMGEASRDFGGDCPTLGEVPIGTERGLWPDDDLFLECTEGSWEAGQPGQAEGEVIGEAGIVVPGDHPYGTAETLTPGTYWLQEVAENAEDMAKLLRKLAPVSVEEGQYAGDYEGCRKVKEWAAADISGSIEHKYYCEGSGLLKVEGVAGGKTEYEYLIYSSYED